MSFYADIYKLNYNGLRIILNDSIKSNIKFLLNKQKLSLKEFCLSIQIDYTTFWDYFNRRTAIPLNFFLKIKEIYNMDFSGYFEYFEVGHLKKRIKIVKNISDDL